MSTSSEPDLRGQHGLLRIERAAAVEVGEVFVAKELDRRDDRACRAVAQRAERLAVDGVGDIEQRLKVLCGSATGLQTPQDLGQPVGAFPARCALAAGLVFVELRPAQ